MTDDDPRILRPWHVLKDSRDLDSGPADTLQDLRNGIWAEMSVADQLEHAQRLLDGFDLPDRLRNELQDFVDNPDPWT